MQRPGLDYAAVAALSGLVRYDDEVDSKMTARAIEFIKENREEPFFVYLALVATHAHITPHEKFRGTSEVGLYGDYVHELDFHVGEIMDTLEELLIHLIKAGFVVLTLSLATGLIFVNDLFGQHLGHKTILSIMA